jgi:hypothetical protein
MAYAIPDGRCSQACTSASVGYTELPQPDIEGGLHRYFWRHVRFGYAEQFADALDDVRSGSTGNFLYHKKSGLIFAHVEFRDHQLASSCSSGFARWALLTLDLERGHRYRLGGPLPFAAVATELLRFR